MRIKTFNRLINIVEQKGGSLLSKFEDCKNITFKVKVRCGNGHIWDATATTIINQNSWCKICMNKESAKNKRQKTWDQLQTIIEQRKGILLSEFKDYKNNKSKIRVKCPNGHIWEPVFNSIKKGYWCRECIKLKSFNQLQTIIEQRKGILLSEFEDYKNNKSKIRVKCSNGHIWEATLNNIKYSGSWCPICSECKYEKKCREIFEKIFSKRFLKKRPKWLISDKNGRMELDGYNIKLRLAFEYNGRHHYQFIKFFHKNYNNLLERQKRDIRKIKLCKKNNITLIIIPYTVKYNDLESYILEQLRENNMIISNSYPRNIQTEITSF